MQTCGTYVKNKKSKNQQVLYVKMFGDFSLKYQGRSLIAKKKKETQFALVLQLIFHSGEEGISREKAFQEILKAVYEKGYEKSKNEVPKFQSFKALLYQGFRGGTLRKC